jgi:DNA processing protein
MAKPPRAPEVADADGIAPSVAWLALGSVGSIDGPVLRAIQARYGSPAPLLAGEAAAPDLLPASLCEAGLAHLGQAKREVEAVRAAGGRVIGFGDPHFSRPLREIADPPPWLAVAGDPGDPGAPAVAIVGSRSASPAGERRAHQWASWLARHGLTIVSGFAPGIDAAAHRGALAAGGRTTAVLGCGLDVTYPVRHRGLRAEVVRGGGALLSEFTLGTRPARWTFPRRNRLISGLSGGVLVIEAAARSGTLITAGRAGDQGRDVWAVPGAPDDPRAQGTNALIRQGARLVEDPAEVLEDLLPGAVSRKAPATGWGGEAQAPEALSEEERGLLAALGAGTLDIDTLAARSALPVRRVSALLLDLELVGQVRRVAGTRFARS